MPDDRDQLFEKALASHLRADGAAEPLCPDTETLAAYHERSLSPEELSAAEFHIVSCSRCQEILSKLEATDGLADAVPDPRLATGTLSAPAEANAQPEASRQEVLVAAASGRSALPRSPVSIAGKRRSSVRWAVPAGAIAAGVLLLIGLREFRVAALKPATDSAQVAENRAAIPAPQESSEGLRAIEQDKDKNKPLAQKQEERQALHASPPLAAPMSRAENALRDDRLDDKKDSSAYILPDASQLSAKAQRSPAMSPRPRAPGPNVSTGQAQAADAIQQSGPAANSQLSLPGVAANAAPPPPPTLDAKSAAALQTPAVGAGSAGGNGPAPAPQSPAPALTPTTTNSPQPGALAEQSVVLAGKPTSEVASYSRAAKKIALDVRIAAPGNKKIWSVGPNGQILSSKDNGQTWLSQISGVSVNLTAGSAASEKVCWIAGAAGTLLRTTDGGEHWQRIMAPIAGDLGGVHATDAQHASIWDVPNRLSYQTTDGGVTWKPSANE